MIRFVFTFWILSICILARGQQNLYVPNNISRFLGQNIIEYGNHIYYVSDRKDSFTNAPAVRSYYLSRVNKHTRQLNGSVLLFRDTAFNVYEEFQRTNISYVLNPATKRFNVFVVSDVDSSLYAASPNAYYPKHISFMQLDTNLNTAIATKPICYNKKKSRYAIYGIGFAPVAELNRTILDYQVIDTIALTLGTSTAHKFLIVDDTGKLLTDEFIGWEPFPIGTSSYFHDHLMFGAGFIPNSDGTYAADVSFLDSIGVDTWHMLLMLDSNLHITDTFNYYGNPSSYSGAHPPGMKVYDFGTGRENNFFLPTGSLVRSAWGLYEDQTTFEWYGFYGVGKGGPETSYRPSRVYFPPPSDTNDYGHSSWFGLHAMVHNKHDNRIYAFSSTKTDYFENYCLTGVSNLGQVAAIDTNLEERWVKYVRPRPNFCIRTFSIAPTDGRNGVIVSGWETSIAEPHNPSQWHPFIYHIDSTTSLGFNNPGSPVIISDQFTVYPNPAKDRINIENVLGTDYSYSIINSFGQAVAGGKGQGMNTKVAVQHLPTGLYLITIKTAGSKRFSFKFLKE